MNKHASRNLITLALCLATFTNRSAAAPPKEAEAGWHPLFDGQTLNGWEVKSGFATYRVEAGAIVGKTAEGSGNSFLCTTQRFGDFELAFEVLLDNQEMNSGVQVRSQIREGAYGGRVHGPQVEIAAGSGLSGFIYGEALKGWLSPELKSGDKKTRQHDHFKNGVWNQFRVRAVGPRVQTWLNDQPIADLTLEGQPLESYRTGLIGLQVHGIGKKAGGPFQVRWRNIQIRSVAALPATTQR